MHNPGFKVGHACMWLIYRHVKLVNCSSLHDLNLKFSPPSKHASVSEI